MSEHQREVARAEALLDAGRAGEAERRLRDALALQPESAPALGLLARALVLQDRADEAVGPARAAVRLEPESAEQLCVLGTVLLECGAVDEARAVAAQAVHLAPDESFTHLVLAHALAGGERDRDRLRVAADAARRAVDLAPTDPDPHNTFGVVQLRLEDHALAERAFRNALDLDPTHAMAQLNLAAVQSGRVELATAADTLTRALAQHPQERELHLGLDRTVASAWVVAASVLVVVTIPLGAFFAFFGYTAAQRALLGGVATLYLAGAVLSRSVRRLPRGRRWGALLGGGLRGPAGLQVARAGAVLSLLVWFAPLELAFVAWWVLAVVGAGVALVLLVAALLGDVALAERRAREGV